MRQIALVGLGVVASALLVASLVSLGHSDLWFVRAIDFVREPLLYLAVILAAATALLRKRTAYVIAAIFMAAAILQAVRLWPYTALAPDQLEFAELRNDAACFDALALNVKQSNRQYDRVADLIDREAPDILLLMETDRNWLRKLAPQLGRYRERVLKPLDNTYGMAFATNLDLRNASMPADTSANTPTLYATLALRNGAVFEFIGLHPRPPRPGQSTETRDANISRAGAITPDRLADVIVMGDFNDVPWSTTTSRFRKEGRYRDPRIGRGTYPTFPAGLTTLGWPLDQIFVKNAIELHDFEILPDVGSDHLPLRAHFCLGGSEDESIDAFEELGSD